MPTKFNGTSLDTEAWMRGFKWGESRINNELRGYADDAFTVRDGILTIARTKDPSRYAGELHEYRSGVIRSKYEQKFGYFEIRCQMPAGRGFWPAFSLLGPDANEIGIQEFKGQEPHTVHTTLHWGTDYAKDHDGHGQAIEGPDFTTGFHTFAVDPESERVIWYVDGAEVFRHECKGVPQVNMHLIANLAIGGNFLGPPDATTHFPGEY